MSCPYCGGSGWYPAFGIPCPYCSGPAKNEIESVIERLREEGFVLVESGENRWVFESYDLRHGIHYLITILYSPERGLYTVNLGAESMEAPRRSAGRVFTARPGELLRVVLSIIEGIRSEIS